MLKEQGTHSQYKPSIYLFPMCLLWHFNPLCTLSSSINSTKHSPLGLPSRENVKWTPCSPSTISTSSVRVKEVNIFYSNFLWSNVLQTLQKIIYLQKREKIIINLPPKNLTTSDSVADHGNPLNLTTQPSSSPIPCWIG